MLLASSSNKSTPAKSGNASSSSSASSTLNDPIEPDFLTEDPMLHLSTQTLPDPRYMRQQWPIINQPRVMIPPSSAEQQRLRRSVPNLLIESHKNQHGPKFTQPPNQRHIKLAAKSPRPPQLGQRLMQNHDIRTFRHHSPHMIYNTPIYSNLSINPPQPVISLNQKCSTCSQVLGQGSAMFIEKLGLAFHLKCFRCSVCSVALGNGKEGTDVRVSAANRLHCNNCFSNDLGNYLGLKHKHKNDSKLSSNEQILLKLLKSKIKIDDFFLLPNYLNTSNAPNVVTSKK